MTRKQKAKWYAGGRPTAVKTSVYDMTTKQFKDVWLSRLRGQYVRFGEAQYHDTAEAAMEDAKAFKEACLASLKHP